MQYNAFVAGVQPGGLTNDFEVKFLICYLLDKTEQPLTFEQLNEILQSTNLVNYFEFADAMGELTTSKHLIFSEAKTYSLGDLGKETVKEFARDIPKSVREKALKATEDYISQQHRRKMIDVTYRAVNDGYQLHIVMKDYGSDLMKLELFLPTKEDCKAIQERIYSDPTSVYEGILSTVLAQPPKA